jgi:CheY-like chemotaxis protein
VSRSAAKILIVDDSELALAVARTALEGAGHTVITETSPFAFGRALVRERPDLVLVDVAMPAVGGAKLVEITRRYLSSAPPPSSERAASPPPECPIVLYSERPADELRQLADECGAAGFIEKSSDMGALVSAVERYLSE